MRIRTLSTLLAAVLMAPAVPTALSAQKPATGEAVPETHTVVKGETLWGIAARYYGDGFRWRSIYELNHEAIANPHWIYPGQVFRMPGAVTSVAVTAAPAAAAAARDTTAVPPAAVAPPAAALAAAPPAGGTVFEREPVASTSMPQAAVAEAAKPFPTVLMGEYLSAPYVIESAKIPGAGRLVGSGDIDPQGQLDSRNIFKGYDDVLVRPPAGASGRKGEQYVVLDTGPALYRIGQVMIPTGIVQVVQDQTPGAAARAQVVALYGEMRSGQVLVPLDTNGVYTLTRPKPVQGGRVAEIKWVLSEPVLPTEASYAVVNLTAADGVKLGDEFTVFRKQEASKVPGDLAVPEIPIGRAKVVRVTPFAVTAIVTAQEQPALNVGAFVRNTARMP